MGLSKTLREEQTRQNASRVKVRSAWYGYTLTAHHSLISKKSTFGKQFHTSQREERNQVYSPYSIGCECIYNFNLLSHLYILSHTPYSARSNPSRRFVFLHQSHCQCLLSSILYPDPVLTCLLQSRPLVTLYVQCPVRNPHSGTTKSQRRRGFC